MTTEHSPDFTAPDDDRPQFSGLPFEKQQEIICDAIEDHPLVGYSLIAEALSQMKPDSTVSDLMLYIAKCINAHYPQEDWSI